MREGPQEKIEKKCKKQRRQGYVPSPHHQKERAEAISTTALLFGISQSQARQFACAIYSNISAYIDAHQAEYEKFLRTEYKNVEEGGEQHEN